MKGGAKCAAFRHCEERSAEAIQTFQPVYLLLLRRFAPRNDEFYLICWRLKKD